MELTSRYFMPVGKGEKMEDENGNLWLDRVWIIQFIRNDDADGCYVELFNSKVAAGKRMLDIWEDEIDSYDLDDFVEDDDYGKTERNGIITSFYLNEDLADANRCEVSLSQQKIK